MKHLRSVLSVWSPALPGWHDRLLCVLLQRLGWTGSLYSEHHLGRFLWNSFLIWSELKFGTFARMFVACFFGLTQGLEERVWTEVELLALLSSRHLNKDTLSRAAPCPSMSSFCFNSLSWWGMKAASQPPILAKLILDVVLAPQQQVPEFGASRPILGDPIQVASWLWVLGWMEKYS